MQPVSGSEMRPVTEIRIAGFGGQGVILAAAVIGKAKAIYQGDFATMTQNFGPEARGGACSAHSGRGIAMEISISASRRCISMV